AEYDAEYAWQDLANYGSSETASDLERQYSKNYHGLFVNSEENVGLGYDFEHFIGTDMYGINPPVCATDEHEEYDQLPVYSVERTCKCALSSN
ncbi:yteA family sporulation protein, partial [Bacillus paranthracis]|nr:yteA family sporulation protein [Bacillus paranthracis]